ncbi:MAG: hypothetical protein NC819_01305 [Candidatus Omnitrophica bacterium]|nr:hypothetical protein [Candidatus Omnitrophota bacterium]
MSNRLPVFSAGLEEPGSFSRRRFLGFGTLGLTAGLLLIGAADSSLLGDARGPRIPTGDFLAAQQPPGPELTIPTPKLFTEKPSPELLKQVEARLKATKGDTVEGKLLRTQLATRLIQLDLLLGKEGSGKFAAIKIAPKEAAEVRGALLKASGIDLNNLKQPQTRKLLWEAIGNAHPSYRLYAEGVKLAGHDDDQELLAEHLRLFKSTWAGWAGSEFKAGDKLFEEWMRDLLADSLRFQAIQTPQEALTMTADLKVKANAEMLRDRPPGDPLGMTPSAIPVLRVKGDFGPIDKAIHQAAALQRAGYETTFWGLSFRRQVDKATDTIVREPLVVVVEEKGKAPVLALGSDAVLEPLKGEKVTAGLWRFSSEEPLKELLQGRGEYQVPMGKIAEAQGSLEAWSRAYQESVEKQEAQKLKAPAEPVFFHRVAGLTTPDPMASFKENAYVSLRDHAKTVFIQHVRKHKIPVTIQLVKEGKTVEEKRFAYIDDRKEEKYILAKQEAAIGRALQILPEQIYLGLNSISLRQEPAVERINTTEVEKGIAKVVVKDTAVWGRAWADRLYFAGSDAVEVNHELTHRWAYANAEVKVKAKEWEGGIIDLFNEIGWRKEGTWKPRAAKFHLPDFGREFAATNPHEDIAVAGERYSGLAPIFRHIAREELKSGNLVPAVKYLYMRQIAFKDKIGRVIEYEIAKTGQAYTEPFTFEEFETAVKGLRGPLTDEQNRLLKIARTINEISSQAKSAGLEAQPIGEILALMEESSQGAGVLVVDAQTISQRTVLQELAVRLPQGLQGRVVLFGQGSVQLKEIAGRTSLVAVDSSDLVDLAAVLTGLPKADRIGFLGDPVSAGRLASLLPASMEVFPLDPQIDFSRLLLFLGIPESVLEQIDIPTLQEILATFRSA